MSKQSASQVIVTEYDRIKQQIAADRATREQRIMDALQKSAATIDARIAAIERLSVQAICPGCDLADWCRLPIPSSVKSSHRALVNPPVGTP